MSSDFGAACSHSRSGEGPVPVSATRSNRGSGWTWRGPEDLRQASSIDAVSGPDWQKVETAPVVTRVAGTEPGYCGDRPQSTRPAGGRFRRATFPDLLQRLSVLADVRNLRRIRRLHGPDGVPALCEVRPAASALDVTLNHEATENAVCRMCTSSAILKQYAPEVRTPRGVVGRRLRAGGAVASRAILVISAFPLVRPASVHASCWRVCQDMLPGRQEPLLRWPRTP